MDTEKLCEDCKNFVRYYVKKITRYMPSGGHCVLHKLKHIRPRDRACDKWELREENPEEQRESLKRILSEMSDRLDQIAQILQGEE